MRKLKRSVAKANMKKKGLRQICKKERRLDSHLPSYFALNWHDYVRG